MLHQLTLMGLDTVIGGGMAGASEDTGKSEAELHDLLSTVHQTMNKAGREALEALGFTFVDEGGVWTGTGAGLLSLLYLLHAKSTLAHIIEVNGLDGPGPEEPIN